MESRSERARNTKEILERGLSLGRIASLAYNEPNSITKFTRTGNFYHESNLGQKVTSEALQHCLCAGQQQRGLELGYRAPQARNSHARQHQYQLVLQQHC